MIKSNYFFLLLMILFVTNSCKRDNRATETPLQVEETFTEKYSNISHVTFYIENSGSMYGYAKGPSQFVEVVNKLAQYPNLIKDNVPFSYYLISGKMNPLGKEKKLQTFEIGNNPDILKSTLTLTGLKRETSGNSDLNEMFKIALNKAKLDSISILISDGIYDVGGTKDPIGSLKTEVQSTTTNFIQRLQTDDIETLLIKLESDFDGFYHPANVTDPSGKSVDLEPQKRPYYVWVFGNSDLLKKYFPEERLEKLEGYIDVARFRKLSTSEYPYAAIGYDNDGFREDYKVENTFKLDRKFGENSKFNLAVDFSNLNLSNSYKETLGNYSTSGNYSVIAVKRIGENPSNDLKPYLKSLSFKPTHIITIKSLTAQPEMGDMIINLDKVLPKWIQDTNTDNDYPFNGSTTTTFGFGTLINGITEAYDEISKTTEIATFKINIKK